MITGARREAKRQAIVAIRSETDVFSETRKPFSEFSSLNVSLILHLNDNKEQRIVL